MLIFFMPDWMLDVKPNCNGILQPLRKVIMLQWKFIWMFGGLSDQDLSSTYHWVGQLSAFLRAKNGTGSSIQVWALSLILISHWCPERLRRTVTRESSTASPGLHWTETCHKYSCAPSHLPGSLQLVKAVWAEPTPLKSAYVTLQFSFPLFQQPGSVSDDVATKFRLPGSLSHSLEVGYLEELLSWNAFHEGKK